MGSESRAMAVISERQKARFWTKLRVSGECLLWTGGKDKDGYGKYQVTNLPKPASRSDGPIQFHVRAHRVAFALANGRVARGLVLHSCDTPACCNPAHLRDGTQSENIREMDEKGRRGRSAHPRPSGENHWRAKRRFR